MQAGVFISLETWESVLDAYTGPLAELYLDDDELELAEERMRDAIELKLAQVPKDPQTVRQVVRQIKLQRK
jgi:hypothetical protein